MRELLHREYRNRRAFQNYIGFYSGYKLRFILVWIMYLVKASPAYVLPILTAEIVNMMGQCLDLMAELAALCPKRALHYLGEGAELAMAAIRACMIYLVDMADQCSDETYRFVIRRENELTLENCTAAYDRVIARVKEAV